MFTSEQYNGLTSEIPVRVRRRVVLPLVHFNDAYQLAPDCSDSDTPQLGGAARFASALEKLRGEATEATAHATGTHTGSGDEKDFASFSDGLDSFIKSMARCSP